MSPAQVVAGLLDPDTGLCANDARFTKAKVVERICAASAGRWTTEEILGAAEDFLASEHVVRLVPSGHAELPTLARGLVSGGGAYRRALHRYPALRAEQTPR